MRILNYSIQIFANMVSDGNSENINWCDFTNDINHMQTVKYVIYSENFDVSTNETNHDILRVNTLF